MSKIGFSNVIKTAESKSELRHTTCNAGNIGLIGEIDGLVINNAPSANNAKICKIIYVCGKRRSLSGALISGPHANFVR